METKRSVAVLVTTLMLFLSVATSIPVKKYVVGDGFGWSTTTNIEVWPRGKKFYAGDILEFKYDYQVSDVRVVKKNEFDQCDVPDDAPRYESGDDKIQLKFGANYFTTSNSEDCQAGLKLAINAVARPPLVNRYILH